MISCVKGLEELISLEYIFQSSHRAKIILLSYHPVAIWIILFIVEIVKELMLAGSLGR